MVASLRGTPTTDGKGLGGDPVLAVPASTVAGDLLVAIMGSTGGTFSTPAGWALHGSSISTQAPLFTRTATAGDVAGGVTYTFVCSGVANQGAIMIPVKDWGGVDAVAGVITGSGNLVLPQVTSGGSSRYLLQVAIRLASSTWTPPGTATERFDANIPTANWGTAIGDETVGAGATGTRTWVPSNSVATSFGYNIAIAPLTQTVSPAGFSASVSFGTPTVVPDQQIAVSGFAPAVQFGTPTLKQAVTPVGFDLPVQFGTPALLREISPAGFDLSVSFGTPSLKQAVTPAGFDVDVVFGTPTVVLDNVLTVTGFDVPVSFGTPTVDRQPFVTATVYNHETGQPLGAGATVQLFNSVTGELVDTTVTGPDGSYIFQLPFGFTDDVFTVVRVEVDGTDYQGVSEVCPVQT